MTTLLTTDETSGAQNVEGSITANDIDILSGGIAFPTEFSTALAAITGGQGLPTIAALSGYGTVTTADDNVATFSGTVTDVGFTITGGNGTDSGLMTSNGTHIFLYVYSGDNNVVLARVGGAGNVADPNGALAFAAYLDTQTSAVGSDAGATAARLWLVQYQSLKHPDGTNANDIVYLSGLLNASVTTETHFTLEHAPSGSNLFLMFGDAADPNKAGDEVAIVVTGKNPANQSAGANISSGDTVSSSQGGIDATLGSNNQMIDPGEGMYFTFVTNANSNFTVPNLSATEANVEANIDFQGLKSSTGASFILSQLQPPKGVTLQVSAFSTTVHAGVDYIDNLHNNTQVAINGIKIYDNAGTLILDRITSGSAGGVTVTFVDGPLAGTSDTSVTISGAHAGYKVEYHTAGDHSRVLIDNIGSANAKLNAAFDIGDFQLTSGESSATALGDIAFVDDAPSISTNGVEASATVDETVLATNATADFSGNFTSSYGADGAGTLVYSLGLSASGAVSGLVDTASGNGVFLFLESGAVVGRQGTDSVAAATGDIVFTITLNSSTGVATLDQVRAIVHPNTANPDDSKTLAGDTLITLTATITDQDGDPATATLNIGQNFTFKDDGPSISTTGVEGSATVDETDLATNATADFSGNFTSAYGADGAGTLAYSLGLSASGAVSGLVDTATGHGVFLFLEAGVVVGRQGTTAGTAAAGDIVFTVSLNTATGVVTLDQVRAIVHPNTSNPDDSRTLGGDSLITLTATKTDKDGDAATATLNIGQNLNFKDDGPSISTTGVEPSATVDETVLATNATADFTANFTSSYGADGAGTLAYSLGVSTSGAVSGLVDTATGNGVFLFLESGVVVGRQGTTAGTAATGDIVFTVSVNSTTGVATLDQVRAIVHPNTGDPDDSKTLAADSLITLTATKTDKDGDAATTTLNIGQNLNFEDDGPSVAFGNLIGTGTVLPQTGFWTDAAGADGLNTAGLNISMIGFTLIRPDASTEAGTFTFGEDLVSPDGSGNYHFTGRLTGDFDNDNNTADTSVDFTLTANADGHYTVDLAQGFASSVTLSTADGSLGAGGPDPVQTLTIGTEQIVFFAANPLAPQTGANSIQTGVGTAGTDPTEAQLQTNPLPSYIGTANMNVSTSGIGVGNNVFQGNTTVGFQSDDESFVVNPHLLLTGMKVFIDNSVAGYDMATEDLYYVTYYSDDTVGPLTEVNSVTPEAGGQVSFLIEREGSKFIDAVQFLMGRGAIKIPVIQFIQETASIASDIKLDFSASVTDKDGDSATDAFSANLFANELSGGFDFVLAGTASVQDAFNIDLSSTKNTYQVTGFDTGTTRDKLVLLGAAPSSVSIDNTGGDSIVSILEAGGQTTTVTVVGVDLLSTDIV
jgi:hypothetical protein